MSLPPRSEPNAAEANRAAAASSCPDAEHQPMAFGAVGLEVACAARSAGVSDGLVAGDLDRRNHAAAHITLGIRGHRSSAPETCRLSSSAHTR
jgi:hypothetical protein